MLPVVIAGRKFRNRRTEKKKRRGDTSKNLMQPYCAVGVDTDWDEKDRRGGLPRRDVDPQSSLASLLVLLGLSRFMTAHMRGMSHVTGVFLQRASCITGSCALISAADLLYMRRDSLFSSWHPAWETAKYSSWLLAAVHLSLFAERPIEALRRLLLTEIQLDAPVLYMTWGGFVRNCLLRLSCCRLANNWVYRYSEKGVTSLLCESIIRASSKQKSFSACAVTILQRTQKKKEAPKPHAP